MQQSYIDYPFTKCLRKTMKERRLTQSGLAELTRTSREYVSRICSGAVEPSLKFVCTAAYILCLSPHNARMFFSDAGYNLDSEHPKMVQARAVLDTPHQIDNSEERKKVLDQLAMFGLAPRDKDANKTNSSRR